MARRRGSISRKTSKKRSSKKAISEEKALGKDAEVQALEANDERDERLGRGYEAPGAGA